MTQAIAGGSGGGNTWPLSMDDQAAAIDAAVKNHGVPIQVFMGMYTVETALGFNVHTSTANAVGPFQFTAANKGTGVLYPMTNTPTLNEFRQQADAAAALLKYDYVHAPAPSHNWHFALMAYNAGLGNAEKGIGVSYANNALAAGNRIPPAWRAALGGGVGRFGPIGPAAPGGTAGAGGSGTLLNDLTSGFRVGDPTNPDEDYWTAINRLAQERYWYSLLYSVRVPTPEGWTTVGDLEPGDYVFGTQGRPIRVLKVFPFLADRDCFRISFRDGTSIVADGAHPWPTTNGILSTYEIAESVTTPRTNPKCSRYNHRISAAVPLGLPEADLPLDPYLFGYWLGDGTSAQPRITVHNSDREHLCSAIEQAGLPSVTYAHSSPGSSQVVFRSGHTGRGHLSPLMRLGVLGAKHIPPAYLRASFDQRLALLQGLMDSDGWICNKSCTFSNVNERLADDVLELVRTLGLQPHRSVRKYRHPVRNPQGGLSIARDQVIVKFGTPEFCPFRLPRKAEKFRLVRDNRKLQRKRYHTIVAVEPVPSEPVRCIEVDSPDHLFLVGESMVPTHNCFSDAETLFLADGPDLMKQTPALEVDRVADAGAINHLELTWDNSAWRFVATHKRRRHTQRRTQLAKVTSPVEAQLTFLCAIDEIRAGDVATLKNCGPGDGTWLAGDVRRSVFEVFSEVNLVVALTPLTEGALNPAGVNKNNATTFLGTVNSKGYTNPVGNWTPGRLDMGVDGTISSAYVAPGDSTIVSKYFGSGGGSWEGWYLAGRFTTGSLKGKCWYVAEGVTPTVSQGAHVKVGTPVARPGPTGFGRTGLIETGWADPNNPDRPLAKALPGFSGDQSPQALACGKSFNRFLVSLKARPGAESGAGLHVGGATMPPGYP